MKKKKNHGRGFPGKKLNVPKIYFFEKLESCCCILPFLWYKTTEEIIFSQHISFLSLISFSIYFSIKSAMETLHITVNVPNCSKLKINSSSNSVFTVTLYIFKHWYSVVVLYFEEVNVFVLLKTSITVNSLSIYILNTVFLKYLSVSNYFTGPLNISPKYNLIFFSLSRTSLSGTSLYLQQIFRSRWNYSFPVSNFLHACSIIQVSYKNTVEYL